MISLFLDARTPYRAPAEQLFCWFARNGIPPPSSKFRQLHAKKEQQSRLGLLFGLGAYGLWGIIPLYFSVLRELPPLEVLAHRILWSFLVLTALITFSHRWLDVVRALRSRRVMLCLAASTMLIAINWYTYIYTVSIERVLESALGYFMTPLVNVLLGITFMRERLKPLQFISLLLALLGVGNLAMLGTGVPWFALILAFSFAFYGLLRKTVEASATTGLFVETLLLAPAAATLLGVLAARGGAQSLEVQGMLRGWLLMSGVITTVPLLLFAGAARRLRLSTLGFLQYLAPSIQFLLAVLVFDEPFEKTQLTSFAFIWMAVAIYTIDSVRSYRQYLAALEPVISD